MYITATKNIFKDSDLSSPMLLQSTALSVKNMHLILNLMKTLCDSYVRSRVPPETITIATLHTWQSSNTMPYGHWICAKKYLGDNVMSYLTPCSAWKQPFCWFISEKIISTFSWVVICSAAVCRTAPLSTPLCSSSFLHFKKFSTMFFQVLAVNSIVSVLVSELKLKLAEVCHRQWRRSQVKSGGG